MTNFWCFLITISGFTNLRNSNFPPTFPPRPAGGFAEKLSSFHSSKAYIFNAAAVPAKTLGEPRGKSVDVFETFWGCDFPKNHEKIHTPIFFNSVIIGNFIPAKKTTTKQPGAHFRPNCFQSNNNWNLADSKIPYICCGSNLTHS